MQQILLEPLVSEELLWRCMHAGEKACGVAR